MQQPTRHAPHLMITSDTSVTVVVTQVTVIYIRHTVVLFITFTLFVQKQRFERELNTVQVFADNNPAGRSSAGTDNTMVVM